MNSSSSGEISSNGRFERGAIEAFRRNPAKFLTDAINTYVLTSPGNWSVPFEHPFFSAPVAIAFGDADSEEFLEIKRKYPWTVTPREAFERPPKISIETVTGDPRSRILMPGTTHPSCLTPDGRITWPVGEPARPPWPDVAGSGDVSAGPPPPPDPAHLTCISIGLPIHPITLAAEASYPWGNSPDHKVHSLWGAHLGFTQDITNFIVKMLQMFGYLALSPYHTTWGSEFTMDFQYEGTTSLQPVSVCPERHWAVAAGLGTFGLTDMVITERGMAVILTTVMTSAVIPPSPKPDKQYCLYFRDGTCTACADRCPGQAMSTELDPPGRLAAKCEAGAWGGVRYNETYLMDRMRQEMGDWVGMSGNLNWDGVGMGRPILSFPSCGRCYTDVPCSTSIPD